MSARNFLIFAAVCLIWALNNVVSKIVVSDMGVPPLFYAALRSVVVLAAVGRWLLPMPRPRLRLLIVALLIGGPNFALIFIGLETTSPSAAAITVQLNVPITTMLSVIMLGEKVRWRRGLGILMTFVGAAFVVVDPDRFAISTGLLFVIASAAASSIGAIMMRQMQGLHPLRIQAWVGLSAIAPLGLLSLLVEHRQIEMARQAGWSFVEAVLFSALVVSVVAHSTNYWLMQNHEASVIAPLTLMNPLFTVLFGVTLTHDLITPPMAAGAAIALLGVLIILLRPNRMLPRRLMLLQIFGRGS
jgi:drug/metabolite transporter (DMT)-like permease